MNDNPGAEGFFIRIRVMIPLGPDRVLLRRYFLPQSDGVLPCRPFRTITVHMVPPAILQRNGKDIHYAVIERFPAGTWIHLLRIAGSGTDNKVGVMTGVDDNILDIFK